jgi:hypothetical protein
MEPLTSAAIAIATLLFTKASEKSGEKLGEVISTQTGRLLQLIKRKSLPKTSAIETAQPIDYGQAVLELETAAQSDAELAQTIQQLAAIIQANPQLLKQIQATANAVESEPAIVQNQTKLAEKIGIVNQGGTINLDNMSF